MSRMTCRNRSVYVLAICLGLMIAAGAASAAVTEYATLAEFNARSTGNTVVDFDGLPGQPAEIAVAQPYTSDGASITTGGGMYSYDWGMECQDFALVVLPANVTAVAIKAKDLNGGNATFDVFLIIGGVAQPASTLANLGPGALQFYGATSDDQPIEAITVVLASASWAVIDDVTFGTYFPAPLPADVTVYATRDEYDVASVSNTIADFNNYPDFEQLRTQPVVTNGASIIANGALYSIGSDTWLFLPSPGMECQDYAEVTLPPNTTAVAFDGFEANGADALSVVLTIGGEEQPATTFAPSGFKFYGATCTQAIEKIKIGGAAYWVFFDDLTIGLKLPPAPPPTVTVYTDFVAYSNACITNAVIDFEEFPDGSNPQSQPYVKYGATLITGVPPMYSIGPGLGGMWAWLPSIGVEAKTYARVHLPYDKTSVAISIYPETAEDASVYLTIGGVEQPATVLTYQGANTFLFYGATCDQPIQRIRMAVTDDNWAIIDDINFGLAKPPPASGTVVYIQ